MFEAVYPSRRRPTIETASTAKEARRVLDWQQDVARSVAASGSRSPTGSSTSGSSASTYRDPRVAAPAYHRSDTYPSPREQPRPMKLVRRETVTTEHYRRPEPDEQGRGGGSGFHGMKLVDPHSPPVRHAPPRRASYNDHSTYSPIVERVPARSFVSRDVDHQPQYVAQYTIAAPPSPPPRRRIEERSSAVSSSLRKTGGRSAARERSRSEAGSSRYDRPLTILPRTHSPQKSSSHVSRRSHSHSHSHKSHRSDDVQYVTASPPRPPRSSAATTTIRVGPREDRGGQVVVPARYFPLGRVGGGGGGGYAGSVAPSDSVSSVGIKRERERLRDRMRERY